MSQHPPSGPDSPASPAPAGMDKSGAIPPLPKRNLWSILAPLAPIIVALAVAFAVQFYRSHHPSSHLMATSDSTHGLKVGSLSPDFSLPDAHKQPGDEPVTLSILAGKSPVLLVFYMGYSCPRCVSHLQQISDRIDEFNKAGLQVLAISPDTLAESKDSIGVYGDFHFPLLSDPDEKVARAFDLLESGGGMHHAVFIVGTDRRIQFFEISDHPYTDLDNLLSMAPKRAK